MHELIVVGFDNADEAVQAANAFKALQKAGGVSLLDAMAVTKDAEGKIVVKDEYGHPIAWGAVIGGALGGLLFFLMPVVGIAAGAAVGAAAAHWMDLGVDRKFVDQVAETLKPNTSAVFLLMKEGGSGDAAVVQTLRNYKGTLIQTNVPTDLEDSLKRALAA